MNAVDLESLVVHTRANRDERARLHEESEYGIPELLATRDAFTPEPAEDLERPDRSVVIRDGHAVFPVIGDAGADRLIGDAERPSFDFIIRGRTPHIL